MSKTIVLVTAALLAFGDNGVSAGVRRPAPTSKSTLKHGIVLPHNGRAVLYDQSQADNSNWIVSQNFESSFDSYDADGADDFTVPAGATWKVQELDVVGTYFNGSGPAPSFNIILTQHPGKKKEKIIYVCNGCTFSEALNLWKFELPTEVGTGVTIHGGTTGNVIRVSVQANLDFATGGEWGWRTNNAVAGKPSVWRNPGDGFGTGCIDYGVTTICAPYGEGGDFAFAVLGKAK